MRSIGPSAVLQGGLIALAIALSATAVSGQSDFATKMGMTALAPSRPSTAADEAVAAQLCRGTPSASLSPEIGDLFGHYRYGDAPRGSLVPVPGGFGMGGCTSIHRDAAGPLRALIAAAMKEAPSIGRDLVGISCYRSVSRQVGLYCKRSELEERGYTEQARWVAPPGFSEHSTGLTLDFGSRSNGRCNLEPCFADTKTGKWLAANASRFGFEMSFAESNGQRVQYEPWHFRYVGTDNSRTVFLRSEWARPQVSDEPIVVTPQGGRLGGPDWTPVVVASIEPRPFTDPSVIRKFKRPK